MTIETREQLESKIAELEEKLSASEQREKTRDSDYKKIKEKLDEMRERLYGKKSNELDSFFFGEKETETEDVS